MTEFKPQIIAFCCANCASSAAKVAEGIGDSVAVIVGLALTAGVGVGLVIAAVLVFKREGLDLLAEPLQAGRDERRVHAAKEYGGPVGRRRLVIECGHEGIIQRIDDVAFRGTAGYVPLSAPGVAA